jgi:RHS repeat-associated protein
MQENQQLVSNEQQFVTGSSGIKDIQYEYDLISGKVNKVLYQNGKWDQFYYQYRYDADNRLIGAYTSRYNDPDLRNWKQEALYRYYLHGPLARMELAPTDQTFGSAVQGVDYAYTLQGWLKGVNGSSLYSSGNGQTDIGGDGFFDPYPQVGQDVFGFTLGYYQGDYNAIGAFGQNGTRVFDVGYSSPSGSANGLFNGNIRWSTYAIAQLENGQGVGYDYHYDQLNRLTGMDRHGMTTLNSGAYTGLAWGGISTNYQEQVSYDGNGNILGYSRNGTTAGGRSLAMDNLTYNYFKDGNGFLTSNRLRHINDAVTGNTVLPGDPTDLHGQLPDYYSYDNIGNLIGQGRNLPDNQVQDKITQINWTVYGKMASIARTGTQGLTFGYDAGGHRITKTATAGDQTGVTTHYVRDAQGNVLAVYQYKNNAAGVLTQGAWTEQHLYGSSRLGMLVPGVTIAAGQPLSSDAYPYVVTTDGTGLVTNTTDPVGAKGSRHYELTNHLGNVLATISDKDPVVNASGVAVPELLSAQDYYPFGMQMPGRSYLASSSLNYRYGFNGKEKDDEVMGAGNEIDYGMRVYDPRAGRFMSVDPLTGKYPQLTPYQFSSNDPIESVDLDGAERVDFRAVIMPNGKTVLKELSVGPKTWSNWARHNVPIIYQAIVEYSGQHYAFTDGGAKRAMYATGLDINDRAFHYAADLTKFLNSPNEFVKSHQSIEAVDAEFEKEQESINFRLGVLQVAVEGLAGTMVGMAGAGEYEGAEPVNLQNTPPKSMTARWVESGIVSPALVKRYNRLNQIPRPFLKFTRAGKSVVRDINKEVNGVEICVYCGIPTIDPQQSKAGVTPPLNESNVDHVDRREVGGSGTPINGDNSCRGCNLKKH